MALKLFKKLFGEEDFEEVTAQALVEQMTTTVAIRELAYQICVQRVAKALSKCEFRTYAAGKEEKTSLYYLLNIKPNPVKSAAEFWQDVVQRLYYDGEALIVPLGDYIYLADSFNKDDRRATRAAKFSNIAIGGWTASARFTTETAVYLQLKDGNVRALLDKTTAMYADLIKTAANAYRKGTGLKLKLKIDRTAQNADNFEERLQEILQEDLKKFFGADNAVYPAYDGYDLENLNGTVGANKYGTTRDITALLDDVLQMTCKAFLMPTNIAAGEVADTSTAFKDFMTFCVTPLVEQIEQALNRVFIEKDAYLNGQHIRINTGRVQHVDVLEASASIDKLIGCGVRSVNDILRILREETIPEEWADKHFITKNYADMENGQEPGKEDP